jgi:predicted DCC family thiol-disulfide oxidoreductase YuxK
VIPTVLYDGTCRFCIAQATRLKRLTRGRVAFESAYAPGVRDRFPMLPPLDATGKMGEMKFVDDRGRVSGGAAAVARAFVTAGGPLGWAARLYWVPPLRQLADRAYRIASARRDRLRAACDDGRCNL